MLSRIKHLLGVPNDDSESTTSSTNFKSVNVGRNNERTNQSQNTHRDDHGHHITGDACIKLLKETEKKGAEKIKQARINRTQMIKKARTEAEFEVKQFKTKKEAEIEERFKQVKEDIIKESIEYDKEVEKTLKQYEAQVEKYKQLVIDKLITEVCKINPHPHHNVNVKKEIERTGTFKRIFPIIERKIKK